MLTTRQYANATSITTRGSWHVYHGATVLCADGKTRKVTRIAQCADTFFSVPCAVRVNGKSVSGYLTFAPMDGGSVETPGNGSAVKFRRYDKGKNAGLLPHGEYLAHALNCDGSTAKCNVCWGAAWDAKYPAEVSA